MIPNPNSIHCKFAFAILPRVNMPVRNIAIVPPIRNIVPNPDIATHGGHDDLVLVIERVAY